MVPASSSHFCKAGLVFLRQLERNNDRAWFEARRAVYEGSVKRPMLQLIEIISERLAVHSPDYLLRPQKNMLRIYRDTRFSADKRPYKDRVAAWWGHTALKRTSGAGFYLHISSKECLIAAGLFMPSPDQLRAMRTALLTEHPKIEDMLSRLDREGLCRTEDSAELLQMPKGFTAQHPAAALVRQTAWGVQRRLAPEEALAPGFAGRVALDFDWARELVHVLNQTLMPEGGAGRPLF